METKASSIEIIRVQFLLVLSQVPEVLALVSRSKFRNVVLTSRQIDSVSVLFLVKSSLDISFKMGPRPDSIARHSLLVLLRTLSSVEVHKLRDEQTLLVNSLGPN